MKEHPDLAFVHSFESGEVQPGTFDHIGHLRLAFGILLTRPLAEALGKMRDDLRGFATAAGVPQKYHETITFALVVLVAERMALAEAPEDFDTFLGRHPELKDWRNLLLSIYPEEQLFSDRARTGFVLPTPAKFDGGQVPAAPR